MKFWDRETIYFVVCLLSEICGLFVFFKIVDLKEKGLMLDNFFLFSICIIIDICLIFVVINILLKIGCFDGKEEKTWKKKITLYVWLNKYLQEEKWNITK